jgi:protocatechuate 3,4-dioxygenase beta subunit
MGHFEFKNVYPVSKQLTCMAEGYGTQVRTPINVEGKPDEQVTVDFTLDVAQPIAGRVVGSDGAGIKGAKILAFNTGNNVSFRGEATSLDDGQFQLNDLHPGSYILQCNATGYRQQKHTRVATGNMDVQIDMMAQARVEGRVVEAASGNPIQNFTCSVRRVAPQQAGGIAASEETGIQENFSGRTDGTFTLSGLDPGTYVIRASAPDAAPTLSETFSVVENQSVANILVRVTRGGSIKGRVVGPDGNGIAGAMVSTHDDQFDEDPMESIFGGLVPTNVTERKTRTDSQGKFEIRFLTPEKYQIRVQHPNYTREKMRALVVVEGQPTDVGAIALKVGGTIKGTVYDAAGKALPRGFVHLESEEGDLVYDVRTDSDGRYVFVHVRPGNYTLSATGQSADGASAFAAITDQRVSQVQITVNDAGEITRDLSLGG